MNRVSLDMRGKSLGETGGNDEPEEGGGDLHDKGGGKGRDIRQ